MASNLLRNLDRVAGVAGNVFLGERERRQALLEQHLQRSQERYLENQRAENTLKTRLSVQAVADKGAGERTERTQQGQTIRERMGIEAGKYDKSRFSYLSRSLKLDPKYTAMLDVGETLYKENLDPLASPTSYMLTSADRERFHTGALLGKSMMTTALQEVYPLLYEKMMKRFRLGLPANKPKPNPGFTPKPGASTNADIETDNKDPFGIGLD